MGSAPAGAAARVDGRSSGRVRRRARAAASTRGTAERISGWRRQGPPCRLRRRAPARAMRDAALRARSCAGARQEQLLRAAQACRADGAAGRHVQNSQLRAEELGQIGQQVQHDRLSAVQRRAGVDPRFGCGRHCRCWTRAAAQDLGQEGGRVG
eukprot:6906343-Prymnesium_polylepis.1